MGDDEDLESLMSHLGEFGKYQWQQFLLLILGATTAGLHMLSVVTVAAVPDHRCALPLLEDFNTTYPNDDPYLIRSFIPLLPNGNLDSCHIIDQSTNETMKCERWVYDTTYFKSSRGMEWNFVCSDRWKGAVTQSSYMFGVFTGAVTLGSLADIYGRKIIFYISAILQLVFGVGVAFVPEYYTYLLTMFLYGLFGSAGSYITGFVITMEIVGPSKRTACGLTFQGMFALGVMLVAFWGALIPDRVVLQIIYGCHSLLLIGHWWLIDESPRWLWSQGRYMEAVTIIEKGIKVNGVETELDKTKFLSGRKYATVTQEQQTYSVLDMFRTPKLRLKSLNVGLNWFANSLVYYGLSLNAGKLFGNPYLVLFILGLVEIPSYFVSTALLDRTGRRCLTSTFMLLGGFACMGAALIPRVTEIGSILATSIVFLGKFCIAGSFAIIYNYSAELFPTVIRNTAVGVGSMCARLSATLTPLISMLDSFDPRVPTVVFATVAIVSGALTLLLPETMNKPMPQSIEDGEEFGDGDTCCTTGCFGKKSDGTAVPLHEMD